MNSLERVVATITNSKRDRPPVFPVMLMQGAKLLDITLQEYQAKGENIAKGQLKLLERFGHDGVIGVPHVVQDVTPWGAGLVHFKEGPPSVSKMIIHEFSQIEELRAPDPSKSQVLKESLKAISILKKELGNQYPVFGAAIAPFSLPSMLMGTEKFMSLIFDDERTRETYFPKLIDEMVKYVVQWCQMQVDAGADGIVLADGLASGTCLRRDQFEKFALPSVRKTIQQIKVPVVYEAVGKAEDILDLISMSGAGAAILDYSDSLIAAKEKLRNSKLTVIGNINNISSLKWTNLKMQVEVRSAMHQMGDHPYIVSFQGPEVPYHMPFELIEEMIETVKKYGKYNDDIKTPAYL